ncbi:short chain dehydrogenase [Tahibacter harae]|uniref:Short chain dehydrogenase n=1 Tax=Tahibacter harae TaxID=2963937 RepID=A0ABT1QYH1_9GAMM|nr:short chain dehydrogenase [Tahibacter harae]MCQ4167333.1 short chain dehydrogenase [Tahibacter harae]
MQPPQPPPPRVLLIGAGGTLGRAVAAELAPRHDVITAGRNSGDLRLDLRDADSIRAALAQAGPLDAVVCAAGNVHFAPLLQLSAADWSVGLEDKLMGQVRLAQLAAEYLRDGGSITLIGGILAEQPIRQGASASLVNGALEAFVRAAAIELPRGLRINLVSPNVFIESMPAYGPYFRGFDAIPVARAALAFSRSVEGAQTGQVYRVH